MKKVVGLCLLANCRFLCVGPVAGFCVLAQWQVFVCWPSEGCCRSLCVGPMAGFCVLAQWQVFVCWPSGRFLCVGPVKDAVGLCVLASGRFLCVGPVAGFCVEHSDCIPQGRSTATCFLTLVGFFTELQPCLPL